MQQYADIYLLLNYSTCFGRPLRPSAGVHKIVVAVSGTDHTVWGANFFKRDHVVTFLLLDTRHIIAIIFITHIPNSTAVQLVLEAVPVPLTRHFSLTVLLKTVKPCGMYQV